MQLQHLRRAGITLIYQEKTSSVGKRPELQRLLRRLVPGQVLTVYKMDRIARSLKDLFSPVGRLTIQLLGAVGEFERTLIRERSVSGQVAAVRRGIVMGRPKVVTAEQAASALRRFDGGESVRNLATTMGVSESALRAALYEAKHGHRIVRRPPRPVLGPLLLT